LSTIDGSCTDDAADRTVPLLVVAELTRLSDDAAFVVVVDDDDPIMICICGYLRR